MPRITRWIRGPARGRTLDNKYCIMARLGPVFSILERGIHSDHPWDNVVGTYQTREEAYAKLRELLGVTHVT